MPVYDQFLKLRAGVHFWCWPLLIFELWCLAAWAEGEARARGANLQILLGTDQWGRVHLLYVSDVDAPANGLETLTQFALPDRLALDAARACGLHPAHARLARSHAAGCGPLRAAFPEPAYPDTS